MADYTLKVMSYGGIVAGAVHYRGRVEGEYPRSCHGGTTYHGAAGPLSGKTTCSQDHVLPERIEWQVEAPWTVEQHERWAARDFDGPSPSQFMTASSVVETAVARFLGQLPVRAHDEKVYPGEPGDRLFLDFVPIDESDIDEEWGRQRGTPPYGSVLAEVPVSRALTEAERITLRHWLQVLSEGSKSVRIALGDSRLNITAAAWQEQWASLKAKLDDITEDLCGRAEPEGPAGAPAEGDEPAGEPEPAESA